jgi:hypothetical protein
MILKRRGWRMASTGQSRVRLRLMRSARRVSANPPMKLRRHRAALMILRIAAIGAMTNCASVSLRGCSLRLDDTEFIGGDDGKHAV